MVLRSLWDTCGKRSAQTKRTKGAEHACMHACMALPQSVMVMHLTLIPALHSCDTLIDRCKNSLRKGGRRWLPQPWVGDRRQALEIVSSPEGRGWCASTDDSHIESTTHTSQVYTLFH